MSAYDIAASVADPELPMLTLHDLGILCEPDSREPWFVCEAHDDRCLSETLQRFETGVERVVRQVA